MEPTSNVAAGRPKGCQTHRPTVLQISCLALELLLLSFPSSVVSQAVLHHPQPLSL